MKLSSVFKSVAVVTVGAVLGVGAYAAAAVATMPSCTDKLDEYVATHQDQITQIAKENNGRVNISVSVKPFSCGEIKIQPPKA